MTTAPITATESEPRTNPSDDSGFATRPPFQLQSLPIEYRWEVTRRHPYYDIWWKNAARYYQYYREESDDDFNSLLDTFALVALQSIGVSAMPPDPATEFSDLDASSLNSAWLSGAVHPISIRGLASMLIDSCSSDTLKYLGTILFEASLDDIPDQLPRRQQKSLQLMLADIPGLNVYFDGPFVALNPAASSRDVLKALEALMRQWKQQYGLGETRNRSDKYADFLQVWDLREGWHRGIYDRTKEKTFKEIARQLKKSVSTISKHYQRAFELIIGHHYSAQLWYRLFGPIKITALTSGIRGTVSDRRPLKSRTPRPVPSSIVVPLQRKGPDSDISELRQVSGDDAETGELLEAIQGALVRGDTDAQILEKLGLSERALKLITYLRHRYQDA